MVRALVVVLCAVIAASAWAHPPRKRGAGAGWPLDEAAQGRRGLQWSMDEGERPWAPPDDAALSAGAKTPLFIRGVTVIGARGARTGLDVAIADGKITAVGQGVTVPEGARVIEGNGKYLIPGLWDMHSHIAEAGELYQNLGWGVTGVRVMWGDESHVKWKAEIQAGRQLGPRLVVASTILDGDPVSWPGAQAVTDEASAKDAVAKAQEMGVDFLKVYSMLTPAAFQAIAAEAKARGITFGGHVPFRVSLKDALAAGQRTFEHFYGLAAACARDGEPLVRELATALDGAGGEQQWEVAMGFDAKFAQAYDEGQAQGVYASIAKAGVWWCPTVALLARSIDDPESPEYARESARREVAFARKALPAMKRAGVRIVAGSDQPNAGLISGDALHEELERLVGSGLTPAEALEAATLEAARCAGVEGSCGSVEAGKEADVVLLDADPLADIRNTRKISAVIARGVLIGADQLGAFRDAGAAGAKMKSRGGDAQEGDGGW